MRRLISGVALLLFLAGCGGGGGGSSGGGGNAVAPVSNVQPITVNGGPTSNYPNGLFTRVTICEPGTATCETVGGILVDTGSMGLRVLQSALHTIHLTAETDGQGNTLENCVAFADGSYLWGPVALADITLSGETAASAPLQIISSSANGIPTGCSGGGLQLQNTVASLGANGILGVGGEPTDCTYPGTKNYCDGSRSATPDPVYWACANGVCASGASAVVVAANQQVVNPVVLFPTDNNGVIIDLPAVASHANTVNGSMIFGIGTQSNNGLGSAVVIPLTNGYFSTTFQGTALASSFLDSGTNTLSFASLIATCLDSFYYCPGSLQHLSTVTNGVAVDFDIDNADTLFNNYPSANALSALGSPQGAGSFDFGLPFYFGRLVFSSIDGQTVTGSGATPWVAY